MGEGEKYIPLKKKKNVPGALPKFASEQTLAPFELTNYWFEEVIEIGVLMRGVKFEI